MKYYLSIFLVLIATIAQAKTNYGDYGVTGEVKTDTISEYTLGSGVTVDGLLIKDGVITESDPVFTAWDKDYADLINTPAGGINWELATQGTIHATNYVDNNTQLSDLDIGAFGYIKSYSESDPVWSASDAFGISTADITSWTAKQNRVTGTCAGQVMVAIAADGTVTCEADDSGVGSALAVEDEGISLDIAVTKLNFLGSGVSAVENLDHEIDVTVAGSAAPVDSVNGQVGVVVIDTGDLASFDTAVSNNVNVFANTSKLAGIEDNADVSTGLKTVTEGANTGMRRVGADTTYTGTIGVGAIDLSYATSDSLMGATGTYSLAQGQNTRASGPWSHAEGYDIIASGDASHAEGNGAAASGNGSHAEGGKTQALGTFSHAEGRETIAKNDSSSASGYYNIGTSPNTVMEVGIGIDNLNRANALEIYTDGTLTAPEATVALINSRGNTSITTKEYVDTAAADELTADELAAVNGAALPTALNVFATMADVGGLGDMTAAVYDPAAITEQVVGLTAIQTLTNKTITAPNVNEAVALTSTATELNLLDGITVLAGSNTGDETTATDIAEGIIELATSAEVVTGTDASRAVTPDTLTDKMAAPGEIGATTAGAATFTTVTASSYSSSAADGSRSQIYPENTAYTPAAGEESIYNVGGDMQIAEGGVLQGSIFTTGDLATATDHAGALTASVNIVTTAVSTTLSASQARGSLVLATAAATITLPTAAAGYSGCLAAGQGVVAIIQLAPATGDYLVVDGVRGTAATAYASSGAAGDKICFVAANADDWYITSEVGTWSE